MPEIIIYTTKICPYCIMAKRFLVQKGLPYTEINVDDAVLREEMMAKTKRRTVPQIFIGKQHIGGFDELYALGRDNKLDDLLSDEEMAV